MTEDSKINNHYLWMSSEGIGKCNKATPTTDSKSKKKREKIMKKSK